MQIDRATQGQDTGGRAQEELLLRRAFGLTLRAEGVGPATVDRYDLSVRTWQSYARQQAFPPPVTSVQVLTYLAERTEQHAPNTVRRRGGDCAERAGTRAGEP